MSARLSVSACSGFKALDDASSGLDGLSVAWSGPRPVAVHGLAAAYVAETRAVPAAIGSACDTVSRWSMSAAVCASALAAAEAQVARLGVHALMPGATDETRVHLSQAITAIDELDVLWRRLCASFSEELSAPLPDPGEPLDEDASIPFRKQLKVDYEMGINHRPTPANILEGEDIFVDIPQLPEPRP